MYATAFLRGVPVVSGRYSQFTATYPFAFGLTVEANDLRAAALDAISELVVEHGVNVELKGRTFYFGNEFEVVLVGSEQVEEPPC